MANNNNAANGRRWATIVTYRECCKNFSTRRGYFVSDGCMEFIKVGEDRTPEAFVCAACHCHRNYHRREEVSIEVDPVMHHMLHHIAAAPVPPPILPILGAYPVLTPVPPSPEENLGDGEIIEQEAGPAEPRRRRRRDSTRRR